MTGFFPIGALLQVDPSEAVDVEAAGVPLWLLFLLVALVTAAAGVALVALRKARRHEAALQNYRTAFEAAPEAVVLLDDDLSIVETNPAATTLLGQPAERLRRTRLLNWMNPDVDGDQLADLRRSIAETGRASFWASIGKGSNARNLDVRISRTRREDAPPVLVGLVYDITEYREEGRLFKTLHERMLAHIPIEVTVLSPQGEYLHISPSTLGDAAMHAWAVGKTDVEFCQRLNLHPEVALRRRAFRRQAVTTGKLTTFDEEIVFPDGERRIFQRIYNPISSEKSVYAVVSYAVERTESRRLQDEANEARAYAGERERLREAIMSNLSHEFRTPLTAILGAAQILSYEVSDHGQEFVEMIEGAGRRLLNTLNSLLDLAGLKEGGGEPHPRILELSREVESVAASFRNEAERKGLFLRTRIPDHDVLVRLDQGHLYRVLQHLTSNAVKFTEEGGIVMELEQIGDQAVIRIMDTGVGIEGDYLQTLFDEFQQESLGIDREFEGVGVGLALTRALVDRLGGSISVESQKGEGSMFSVFLPLAFRVRHNGQAHPARVLLLESSTEDRRIATYALNDVVEVIIAEDLGHTDVNEVGKPDAVLISITGPDVNPKDVLAAVARKEGLAMAPVIALDGYPLPGNRETYLSAGFAEYVPKPLNRQVLLEAVGAVCSVSRTPNASSLSGR